MNFDDIYRNIYSAICNLYCYDYELFLYNTKRHIICERTLTFRLGYYLQDLFPDYNVDCEYNRYLDTEKRINEKNVFPDIIIHKRKTYKDNLVWIEVKKGDNLRNAYKDKKRLEFVTVDANYRYKYGVFIALFDEKIRGYLEFYECGKLFKKIHF